MNREREWIARCCSLAQTERDIMRQLSNVFDRTSEFLTREERESFVPFTKSLFQPSDRSFIQQFHQASQQIANIRPAERGFKTRLDRLEREITQLRVSSAADLEKVNVNVHRITDDIEKREKRFAALETPALRPRPRAPIQFQSPINEFEHFLSRYGRTGGWDPASHAEFLRMLERHGERELSTHLSDVPEDAVQAHLDWYSQFKALKQRMKEALNDLKVRQKSEKAQIEISEPMSPSVDAAVVKQRMEERERLRQQQRQETEGAAEQAKKAQEDLRKQRFTKLKGELAKRKVERPQKIEEAPVEHVEVRRSQFSTQDWAKMRRRDDALIERKNAIAQAQEEQRIKREEIQRKLADQVGRKFRHAKRDPERLMQPTAAVRARMEAKDDEPKGPVNSVFEIPHRAMPAWMQ